MFKPHLHRPIAHLGKLIIIFSVFVLSGFANGQPSYESAFLSYQAGDYKSAFEQFSLLAGQSDARAQYAMGTLYHFGQGVNQDYEKALTWFQKAADQGLAGAANQLGDYYLRGHGVPKDPVKSFMWFSLAGPGESQADKETRAEVTRLLSPVQISEGLSLAQQWRQSRSLGGSKTASGSTVRWSLAAVGCEERWSNGSRLRTVKLSNMQVTASILELDRHVLVALVEVKNLGIGSIDVFPRQFSLQVIDPQSKNYLALAPEQAALKQSVGEGIAAVAAGFANGWNSTRQRRTGSATVRMSDGTSGNIDIYSSGPTTQEIEQQKLALERKRAADAKRSEHNQELRSAALLANTLNQGASIEGAVYFHRDKKPYRRILLSLPIAGSLLEIPFEY